MRTACCCACAWLMVGTVAFAQQPSAPASDNSAFIVAGQVDGAPTECTMSAVASRIAEFFNAVNAGSPEIAESFFGRRPTAPFQWFSFSDLVSRLGYETLESPGGLNAHFAKRHASGNRWVLRGVEFNGWVPEREGVGFLLFFEYYLRNATSGHETRQHAFGKAEFHCPSSTFVVMSLGLQEEEMWNRLFRTHVLSRRAN